MVTAKKSPKLLKSIKKKMEITPNSFYPEIATINILWHTLSGIFCSYEYEAVAVSTPPVFLRSDCFTECQKTFNCQRMPLFMCVLLSRWLF